MRALAEWHDARYWSSPSELLDRIVRERRVLEVGLRARAARATCGDGCAS